MKKITWKKVKGFEETHKVSSEGEIIKVQKLPNGEEKLIPLKPLITKRKNSKPSANVCLNGKDGKKRFASIGRIVAETFLPNPNKYMYVNHKDGNCENNKVENLEWSNTYNSAYHAKIEVLGKVYRSLKEASKSTGISEYQIARKCNQSLNMDYKYLNKEGKKLGEIISLPKEEWKYIDGTGNQFMVSNLGRIKSCIRFLANGTFSYSEKLVKQTISEGKARVNIRIYKDGNVERKYLTVIYEVYKAFAGCGDIPSRYLKNIDGNLLNCKLSNIGVE